MSCEPWLEQDKLAFLKFVSSINFVNFANTNLENKLGKNLDETVFLDDKNMYKFDNQKHYRMRLKGEN